MNLSRFINRPVLSTVISILLVILGFIGLATLPITQYPDIAPPTVSVSATYTGANAQTVLNSVISPLEDQINGVEGMMYMTSDASNNGSASITIYFNQGTDPDMAQVNVQNRVSAAQGLLPQEVTQIGVTTRKRQTSMLLIFSIYDMEDKYNIEFIENYANINIIPEIKRVAGVGDAMVMGADYSMRIWLKPDVMAQYKLIPADISEALAEQNIEAAPGQFGERSNQTFQYTIRYRGRLQTTEEFENIVIESLPDGEVLRLKDVADIELGRNTYGFDNTMNGHKGVSCIVFQMAGTNATQTIQDLEKVLDDMQKSMPAGLGINIAQSANDFLFASIHEVVKTLIEAFILVFIVVYIFLQDMRSTLIPAIAIPVALIATFFVLKLIGFSLNLLTHRRHARTGRRTGQHHAGHDVRVHPRELHGRYGRYVLPAVRSDHGHRHLLLRRQRPDAEPRPVCHLPEAAQYGGPRRQLHAEGTHRYRHEGGPQDLDPTLCPRIGQVHEA